MSLFGSGLAIPIQRGPLLSIAEILGPVLCDSNTRKDRYAIDIENMNRFGMLIPQSRVL